MRYSVVSFSFLSFWPVSCFFFINFLLYHFVVVIVVAVFIVVSLSLSFF